MLNILHMFKKMQAIVAWNPLSNQNLQNYKKNTRTCSNGQKSGVENMSVPEKYQGWKG